MFPGVYRIQADPGRIAGNTTACARARGNFTPATPRKSAHHPSSRVSRTMAEFPCAAAASFPKKINCQKFIEKPREFIEFYRIFRNSLGPNEPIRSATIPKSPVCARTSNAGKYAFSSMGVVLKNRSGRGSIRMSPEKIQGRPGDDAFGTPLAEAREVGSSSPGLLPSGPAR